MFGINMRNINVYERAKEASSRAEHPKIDRHTALPLLQYRIGKHYTV